MQSNYWINEILFKIISIKFLFKKYWIYENKVIFKPNFNDNNFK